MNEKNIDREKETIKIKEKMLTENNITLIERSK